MKILSIGICRWNEDTEEPVVLHNNHEVSEFGFFQRSGYVHVGRSGNGFVVFWLSLSSTCVYRCAYVPLLPSGTQPF